MAMTTCPHCEGVKKNYIIEPQSDPPKLKEKNCVLCGGTGEVPLKDPPKPPAPPPPPPPTPELWPLLIPLGIFVLFFFFLWL